MDPGLFLFLAGAPSVFFLGWLFNGPRGIPDGLRTFFGAPFHHKGRLTLLAAAGPIVIGTLETAWDPSITGSLDYEITSAFAAFEGDFPARAQAMLTGGVLTAAWWWIYVLAYPLSIVVLILGLNENGRRTLLWAYGLNVLLALPFYAFFPVIEPGAFPGSGVATLLNLPFPDGEVLPGFVSLYRNASGVDNCFPSLHASIAVTAALVAHRCGTRRQMIVGYTLAALVFPSTLAMGVHWAVDLLAGIPFALTCFVAGVWITSGEFAFRVSPALRTRS